MKIQVLSEFKKKKGISHFTKREIINTEPFFYDEDCLWFDYNGVRFGLPYPEIVKLRKNTLKSLRHEIKGEK